MCSRVHGQEEEEALDVESRPILGNQVHHLGDVAIHKVEISNLVALIRQ